MVNASGGKSKSTSRTYQFDPTQPERALQGVNMKIVREQFGQLLDQQAFQEQAFSLLDPFVSQLMEEQGIQADLFTPEERRQQLLDQYESQQQLAASQDELLQLELERIRQGPEATPEQRELINQATEAQIARGESDIEAFGQRTLSQITQELAPIQDRAFALGGELARQQGQLVSGLRGAQAQAELNFPLAANAQQAALSQFQQQLGQSSQQFQQQLRQQAGVNRQNLFGQIGQLGLGLLQAGQPSADLQQAFKPALGQQSESRSVQGGGGIMSSSRALKKNYRKIDANEILERLLSIPVERWEYLYPDRDTQGDHIGPYSEDFQMAFEIGDGQTINYIDAIGVLIASVQALSKRVEELSK
jgi:hypothetical protein